MKDLLFKKNFKYVLILIICGGVCFYALMKSPKLMKPEKEGLQFHQRLIKLEQKVFEKCKKDMTPKRMAEWKYDPKKSLKGVTSDGSEWELLDPYSGQRHTIKMICLCTSRTTFKNFTPKDLIDYQNNVTSSQILMNQDEINSECNIPF